ncbi:MAG: hypothetical protein ACTSR8_20605 [Promethearchaeota archaeon]
MKLYSISKKGELILQEKLEFKDDDSYIVDDVNTIYIWIGKNVSVNHKDVAVRSARNLNREAKSKNAKLILLDQGQEYGAFKFLMNVLKEGVPSDALMESRGQFELKAPDHITENEPEVAENQINNVVEWLDQLKGYRSVVESKPIDKIEEEPFEEEILITSKPKVPQEGIFGWLNQLKTYRGTAPAETEEPIIEKKEEYEKKEKPPEIPEDLTPEINLGAYFLSKEGHSYDVLCWLMAEKQLSIQMKPNKPNEQQIREKAEQVFQSSTSYDELCWLIAELTIYEKYGYFDMF